MNVPWEVWAALGVILGGLSWRISFRFFVNDITIGGEPDTEDVAFAFALATVCLAFTPLILACTGIWRTAVWVTRNPTPAAVARTLGGESRAAKREREARERKERERYIARLERELGIDASSQPLNRSYDDVRKAIG